ncbi:MAG: DUF4921 family protein [bacterium]|nr:DUF4921 family protein [bacterium]
MSQWRQDPLTGRWVVIAEGRHRRPDEFAPAVAGPAAGETCPFCPGHEHMTTPEITARGRRERAPAGGPGWRMRVFGNMFPAVRPGDGGPLGEAPWPARPGRGHHEVVVFTPEHGGGLHTLADDDLAELLLLLRERMADLAACPEVAHVLPFFNQGGEAGATLAHPHGQIIATPLVPQLVATKLERMRQWRGEGGGCLLCDLLAREEATGERIVAAGDGALVLAPWASRFPCELLAAPRRHVDGPVAGSPEDCTAVARVLGPALRALAAVRPEPPLNMILHAGPAGGPEDEFHWHLEILPRWTRLAGFEAGSGFAINSLAPETAARRLREEVARCAS